MYGGAKKKCQPRKSHEFGENGGGKKLQYLQGQWRVLGVRLLLLIPIECTILYTCIDPIRHRTSLS